MKVIHLQNTEIDRQQWDDCIYRSINGLIYGLSWYLDIVSPGWAAIVAVKDDTYTVCLPLPIQRRFGIKYIIHPYFCQQLGLFFRHPPKESIVEAMISSMLQTYLYIPRFSFNTNNTFIALHGYPSLTVEARETHLLSLDRSYSELYRGYRRDRRHRIKQAKKKRLDIIRSNDIRPLIRMYQTYIEHRVPGAGHDADQSLLRSLFIAVAQRVAYKLYYVREKDGSVSCGCWFVFYKNTIIYLFNAATDSARNDNGRSLIIDRLIYEHQNTDYVLDFETPPKDSLASFYQSFGSSPTPFPHIHYYNMPIFIRKLHRTKMKLHRKILATLYPKRVLPDIFIPE